MYDSTLKDADFGWKSVFKIKMCVIWTSFKPVNTTLTIVKLPNTFLWSYSQSQKIHNTGKQDLSCPDCSFIDW